MEHLDRIDKTFFLLLNGWHVEFLDPIVFRATGVVFWIPFFLWITYTIAREKRWDIFYVLVGAALTVALSDQLTSSVMKPFFGRLRPSRDLEFLSLIHI